MKKRKILILIGIIFIFLPLYIKADTYEEAENKVNTFLEKNEYKNSYNKYFYTTETNKFSDMISKNEFDITRGGKGMGYSYLWNSHAFWSNTKINGKNIPIRTDYKPLEAGESTDTIGTRVTQYLQNKTIVYGSGTYSDPWIFSPQYNVRIKVNDTSKGYITNSSYSSNSNDIKDEISFVYTAGSGLQYIYIKSLGSNKYVGTTCSGNILNSVSANLTPITNAQGEITSTNGYLLLSNITRDTECILNFGEKPRTVILDQTYNDTQSYPQQLYVSTERGWFKDSFGNEQITQIDANPARIGYNYNGYYLSSNKDNACDGTNVINKNKNLAAQTSLLENLTHNTRIYPCYTPIKYYIAYNCPNGTPKENNTPVEHIYNVTKRLESDRCSRTGYDLEGWSRTEDGLGDSYAKDEEVTGIHEVDGGTLNLYSKWKPKNDIKYVVQHWQQKADGGTEHNSTNFDRVDKKENNNGIADETITVTSNTYEGFSKPESQNIYIKPDGSTIVNFYYTRNTYTVEYNCNGGEGTTTSSQHRYGVDKALTANGCTNKGNQFAGWATSSNGNVVYSNEQVVKNLSTENGAKIKLYAKWSECAAGTYGSNGKSCSSCPIGYTSNAGSDAQSDCYINVAAGKYIASAGDSTPSSCGKGTYKTAHTVKYGEKSSCETCPSGYQDGSGTTSESNCTKNVAAGNYIATAKGGTTSCGTGTYKTAHTVKYGETSKCSDCPSGYQDGSGTTAKSNCIRSVAAGNYIKTANDTSNTACGKGTYKAKHDVKYGETSKCSDCPSGYQDGSGTTAKSNCIRSVAEGNYIKTANDTSNTACGKGTYKAKHDVKYGETSKCSDCPSGYQDGSGTTAKSNCIRSVSAGNYIKTANDTSNTTCAAGTYKAKHNVKYGETSKCSDCPDGTTSPAGSVSSSDCTKPQVTYTATFNKNGADSVGSATLSCTADQGSSCTVKAPTISAATGFSVVGWNTSSTATTSSVAVGGTITLSSDKTYYAITKSSGTKKASFVMVDSSGNIVESVTSTYKDNYSDPIKTSVTCTRYNGSSSYRCVAPERLHLYARGEFDEELFEFGGWSETKTNQSKSFGAGEVFYITGDKTYYQISTVKSVYYSSSIYGTSTGTNVRKNIGSSGGVTNAYGSQEALNLTHKFKGISWRYYTGESSCYNYVWIYGDSQNETWYPENAYACSWYLGLKSRT